MRRIQGSAIKKNVLIDINNYIYRSYFSLKLTRPELGKVTVRLLDLLNKALRDITPFDEIHIFFDGKSQNRIALNSDYKSNRVHTDIFGEKTLIKYNDELTFNGEEEVLRNILSNLGCTLYRHPLHEADDLIASFCHLKSEEFNVVVSDDKDLHQLLSLPRTIIYRSGNSDNFIDAEKSSDQWARLNNGTHPRVNPQQIRMFKSLCGDSSDNISGVPKLFRNRAIKFCEFSSPDELYNSLDRLDPADKSLLLEYKDLVYQNWELVGLVSDIKLDIYKTDSNSNYEMAKDMVKNIFGHDLNLVNFKCSNTNKSVPLPTWYDEL